MASALPNWVYDLIIAVKEYEDVHGPREHPGTPCFAYTLGAVPEEHYSRAEAIGAYLKQRGETPEINGVPEEGGD